MRHDPLKHNNHGLRGGSGDGLTGWMQQWLPPCSAHVWSTTHMWTVAFAAVEIFGLTIYVPKACLDERCECLDDSEVSE